MSETENHVIAFPHWLRGVLLISAALNFIWGLVFYNFPEAYLKWIGFPYFKNFAIFDVQAVLLLVAALFQIISAFYPTKTWFLIWLSLALKLSDIFLSYFLFQDNITGRLYFYLIFNDFVWIALIGYIAYKVMQVRAELKRLSKRF